MSEWLLNDTHGNGNEKRAVRTAKRKTWKKSDIMGVSFCYV